MKCCNTLNSLIASFAFWCDFVWLKMWVLKIHFKREFQLLRLQYLCRTYPTQIPLFIEFIMSWVSWAFHSIFDYGFATHGYWMIAHLNLSSRNRTWLSITRNEFSELCLPFKDLNELVRYYDSTTVSNIPYPYQVYGDISRLFSGPKK